MINIYFKFKMKSKTKYALGSSHYCKPEDLNMKPEKLREMAQDRMLMKQERQFKGLPLEPTPSEVFR